MKNILSYIKCRFNMHYAPTGAECDEEFLDTLKGYLEEYFSTPLRVFIKKEPTEIDMCRYLREELVIEIDTNDCYVTYPTCVTIKKEIRGYTLIFKIRGINHSKMLEIVNLANGLIEAQDDINYPLGN